MTSQGLSDPRRDAKPFFQQHAVALFFVLAFAMFALLVPLATLAGPLVLGLGTFAPAIAAFIVAGTTEGRTGIKALLGRIAIWRVGLRWYASAIGIPLMAGVMTVLAAKALGTQVTTQPIALLMAPLFVLLAFGEEIGWRGFALPGLMQSHRPITAVLILGVVHALFHVPLWIAPGLTQPAYTFMSFVISSLCFSVVWTWLFMHARGSVLIATLFHASINLFGNLFYPGIPSALLNWLMPAGYAIFAALILASNWQSFTRRAVSA